MLATLKIFLIGVAAVGFVAMVVVARMMHKRHNQHKARIYAYNRSMFIS
jgi:Co/Zn/Cd efflux system component